MEADKHEFRNLAKLENWKCAKISRKFGQYDKIGKTRKKTYETRKKQVDKTRKK